MTKDEALDLALEALEEAHYKVEHKQDAAKREQAITAIKQARALDKKAENARELGLDYEPADGTQVSKVWWDGEKLMAKPIPLEDIYQPEQEPDLIARLKNPEDHYEFTDPKKANAVLMSLCQEAADALAAPVQPMAHIVGEIDHTGKVWKPVQPAPVPLTDDPLQGAVDWLLQADGEYFYTANVQRTLRIGYNRAKRLCDTAKERAEAAHGITKGQP
jgi:DNA segregation ATPase FtsK/SpoIIIE-like protein